MWVKSALVILLLVAAIELHVLGGVLLYTRNLASLDRVYFIGLFLQLASSALAVIVAVMLPVVKASGIRRYMQVIAGWFLVYLALMALYPFRYCQL